MTPQTPLLEKDQRAPGPQQANPRVAKNTVAQRTPPQRPTTTVSLLDAARAYVRRGWTVIPTHDKQAVGKWKDYQTARPDEHQLRELFARPGITGLAVLLGSASGGLVCRDFDDQDSYERWAAAQPELARSLPTVETARGRHVYFRGPEGFVAFDDGEYRGDAKHYCLLPPSRHPSGHLYCWTIPLPPGSLPAISDPRAAGLLHQDTQRGTEKTETTEQAETDRENTENRRQQKQLCRQGGTGEIEAAIVETLPTRAGQRNRKIFDLCRRLQALPDLATLDPGILRPVVTAWHERALLVIGTKEFSETYADFILAWAKVKYPAGNGKIEAVFDLAQKSQSPQKAVQLYDYEESLRLLASLCRELQRQAGDADFFLDCRTAGRLLGVPHNTAWRWLTILCVDGLLRAGEKGSQAKHKANRYRYLAD